MVSCCWGNIRGLSDIYDPQWFDAILRISPTYIPLLGIDPRRIPLGLLPAGSFYRNLYVDETRHTRLSILSGQLVYLGDNREYNSEFIMRTYISSQRDRLLHNGFLPTWQTEIRHLRKICKLNNIKILIDVFVLGPNNQLQRNIDNGTSYSWRNTSVFVGIKLFYYQSTILDSLVESIFAHIDRIFIGRHGLLDPDDRRMFGFSYTRPSEDGSLDTMWPRYYDSQSKYTRVKRIKQQLDPDKVFSPNRFYIGGMERGDSSLYIKLEVHHPNLRRLRVWEG